MRSLALLLYLLLPAAAGAEPLIAEFAAESARSLRIQLDTANVDVITHAGDRLRLEARAGGVGASGLRFRVDKQQGQIVLRSVSEPWLAWLRTGPRVHVRVLLPRGLHLEVETAGRIVSWDQGVERAFPARSTSAAVLPSPARASAAPPPPGALPAS